VGMHLAWTARVARWTRRADRVVLLVLLGMASDSRLAADHVSISEAAWLCRVNDDTVREWRRKGLTDPAARSIAYEELKTWAASHNRPLLPLAALTTSPEDWPIPSNGSSVSGQPELMSAQQPTTLDGRERALRITIRELLNASVHERSELAARDRALTALLDALEAETQ
jgi:hypothetical protein